MSEPTATRRSVRVPVLLAGVAVVAILLTWRAALRSAPVESPTEGATVELLVADQAPVPRDEVLLVWDGPEHAEYRVEAHLETGAQLLIAEGVARTEIAIPPAAIGALPEGTLIYWEVEATLPDGSTVASPTQTVVLR